jgi:hypothetical protein
VGLAGTGAANQHHVLELFLLMEIFDPTNDFRVS